ncbi:MauE/DoxX family redox-associated membrane protein [Pedobacter nyackensis]|uniref:Methylamine utilisation protein MauE n=1 Tax=Pedobacter nyackensis TaxID=475255 RepID=A0A1W2EFI8_9SPHI|nr:MauE/DoxX family redox-associated membrane protein [Pedobacter nyackensis]SMD08491.1 Methylamine utilisation protein MauE [Pedobacter nyackensis]
METKTSSLQTDRPIILLSVVFILFWLFSAGSKLYDFNTFKGEMNNQVFSASISNALAYTLPAVEITIAALLVYSTTRFTGMILSCSMMLIYTTYVGLALLDVYNRIPCNCAGLLGSWEANLILNLFVTAVAATGLILNLKFKERRAKVWIQ